MRGALAGEPCFNAVADALLAQRWTFAKTMPHNPHEYVLRKSWLSAVAFDQTVMFIREHGYPVLFGGRRYVCLDVQRWRHWTMGDPLATTWLINRALNTPGRNEQD